MNMMNHFKITTYCNSCLTSFFTFKLAQAIDYIFDYLDKTYIPKCVYVYIHRYSSLVIVSNYFETEPNMQYTMYFNNKKYCLCTRKWQVNKKHTQYYYAVA